jgi:hypothetical protein
VFTVRYELCFPIPGDGIPLGITSIGIRTGTIEMRVELLIV